MKSKIKYILMVIILPLMLSNQIFSQEEVVGSWIISSEHTYDIGGYKNYQINFSENGIIEPENYHILNENQSGEWDFVFSLGAYQCDGTLDLYLTDNYYYYNTNQIEWPSLYDNFENYRGDVQIIRTNEINKYLLFCYGEINGSVNYLFQFVEIDVTDPIPSFEENEFPLNYPNLDVNKSPKGFIISNKIDGISNIYVVSTPPSNPLSGYAGLERYSIEDNEVSFEETLISDDNNAGVLTQDDYSGYNLEMQNKNEIEDPNIAWITSPLISVNSKIFVYDADVDDEHYCLDFSEGNNNLIETGRIAGIEFSPFPDEQDFMYVSCEMLGLIKINWHTGELIEQYTQGEDMDFSHSHVQTAPDGNIYVVSDDGSRLGKIDKTEDHLLDINAFTYPVSGNAHLRHINIAYTEDDEAPIKYYTLPENDFQKINTHMETTDNMCDIVSGSASIFVYGGVPNYTLEYVKNENGDYFTSLFTFNTETNSFDAPNIDVGTYEYKITDESECEDEIIGYFTIGEGDIYDFEQDLLEIDENASTEIYGLEDMVWDANDNDPENGFIIDNTIMFKHGFALKDNQTLTINDLRLEFDEDYLAKVIIEPGSKLILNNCTLTNYHCWDPDAKWAGVEVWGNSENGQEPYNGIYWQGYFEINNSIIEHAKNAIYLGYPTNNMMNGGILKTENSIFRNNQRSIYFPEYHNRKSFPEGIVELNNVSYIRYSEFYNDENYLDDDNFKSNIKLESVKGISIKDCNFNSGGKLGMGIDAFNAGFYVSGNCDNNMGCTPEEWDYSSFTGYDKAIYVRNASGTLYSVNIQHGKFDNNQYGVYADNLNHVLHITNSIFKVGLNTDSKEKSLCTNAFGRGIHITGSNNFHIEYNHFEPAAGLGYTDDIMGISASENPSEHDIIYANDFESLKIGNLAYGVNRARPTYDIDGIEYQCNDNFENFIDFELNKPINGHARIHTNQGEDYISARNSYSSNSDPYAKHWRNMGTQTINYYLHTDEIGTIYEPTKIETLEPGEYFEINTNVSNINQCPDNDGIHQERTTLSPEEIQEEELNYYEGLTDFQAVETIYNDLKDGGSTEGTTLTIASAQADDTWELRANLLGKSPHLSKQVLMEAADRTDVLPNSVLLDILAANPDELKKADLMEYLENKVEPLPDYMIDILQELSHGTTYKTVLLNQMSRYKRQYMKSANIIVNSLINEEQQDYNEIRNWLDNIGSINADLQIAETYIYESDFAAANSLLDLIPDLYDLQGDALNDYLDDKNMLLMQIDLLQSNRSLQELNEAELAQLEIWAANDKGKARAFARNVLETHYGNNTFCDCIDRNENKSSFTDFDIEKDHNSPLFIEATPNPATHYVEFNYKLSDIDTEGMITISDINGKIIQVLNVKNIRGVQAWDIRNIPAGSYIYTLKTKYFEKSGKLIIQ